MLEASCQWSQFRRPSISRIPTQKNHWRMPWENKLELENFHLWELLWREGVILVNCEPQLHRMMSFQMKSPCRRVDIYQVSPFPTFLLSRVYQLLSKPTREHFPPLCDLKKSKMVSVSFSHCHKFPYYYGFEQGCTWRSCAQVSAKFDSTPPIAYPLSPNYSNHCIYP